MSKEKKSGFGKGVIFGILLAALLAGGFFWFTNRAEKNKAEVEKGKTEKVVKKDKTANKKTTKKTDKKDDEKKNQGGGDVKDEDLVLVKEDMAGKVYEDTFNEQNFSFVVKEGWKTNEKVANKIGLLKKDQAATKDNVGDIVISFKSNKQGFGFDRYYDGLNDVNYFADASDGFDKMKINGLPAYKFKGVIGYNTSTVVVIKTDKGYVEFSDDRNKYQDNGVFEKTVGSFEIK